MIKVSCDLTPSPRIVAEARPAEELGYTRACVTDSQALHGDAWISHAQIAEHTSTIGLSTGVLVPFTGHRSSTGRGLPSSRRWPRAASRSPRGAGSRQSGATP